MRQWTRERRIGSRPWRALIASTDAALGDLYRSSLESRGWEVEVVRDGQSAWKRAVSSQPDVLLLNSISDVKHRSLLQRLRAHQATRNLKVILLANAQPDDDIDQGSDFGIAARLIKSWTTRDKLPEIVGAIVERRTTSSSSSHRQ